jgi:SAM-dependent methyltransferase
MANTRVTRGTGLLEGFLARRRAKVANRLIPQAHRDGLILDVGCGSYPLFLTETPFASKIGMDRMVEGEFDARAHNEALTLIRHDFENDSCLPIHNDSCTVVTMLAVIEHIEPDRVVPLLREIHRVLEPAGVLILTTPAAWVDLILRAMAGIRLVSPVEINEHKAAYTRRLLRSVLGNVFPEGGLQIGFFEMYMNIWATALKPRTRL